MPACCPTLATSPLCTAPESTHVRCVALIFCPLLYALIKMFHSLCLYAPCTRVHARACLNQRTGVVGIAATTTTACGASKATPLLLHAYRYATAPICRPYYRVPRAERYRHFAPHLLAAHRVRAQRAWRTHGHTTPCHMFPSRAYPKQTVVARADSVGAASRTRPFYLPRLRSRHWAGWPLRGDL